MALYKTKKDISIFRFAIPFFKDAIERNNIFYTLYKINSEDKFSEWKLIHIATLSIECMLKSILLLSFYNHSSDWKIKKRLKDSKRCHNLESMLNKIQSKYNIQLNSGQKNLIKIWWTNWIFYRYWIDAFFNFVKTKWINSDKLRKIEWEIKEQTKRSENYNIIYNKLFILCKNIIEEYGWLPFDLLLKSTIQIPDCQFNIMRNIYD